MPETSPGPARERAAGLARIVLALLPLALVGPAVFGDRLLVPLDALLAFEPWRSVAPAGHEPANPLLLDQAVVVLPWLEFAAERLRAGELPLWNPHNYLGQPIHAALTGAFLWPLSWLYFVWPDFATIAFVAWIKLALAGLGMHALLRQLGTRTSAAFAGAVGWQFAGFQVAWLGHPHTNASVLLPWLLVAIERLSRAPPGLFPRRPVAALAGIGALLGVAGHLPTAWHVTLVAVAWTLWRLFAAPPLGASVRGDAPRLAPRRATALVAAAALGGCLAAPQLLPFAEYTAGGRGVAVAEDVARAIAAEAPPVTALAPLLVAPHWHGDPLRGDYAGPEGAHLNHVEIVGGHVGWPLVLAALACLVLRRREPATWAVFAATLLAAAVAWSVPPFGDLARLVPGLAATKPLRLLLAVAFGIALLGALGIDAAIARAGARPWARAIGPLAALATVIVLVAAGRGYNPLVERALVLPPTSTGDFLSRAGAGERALGTDGTILMPNANLFVGASLVTGYDSIENREMADVVALLSSDERGAWFVKEIRWFDRGMALAGLLGVRWMLATHELPLPSGPAHRGEVLVYENPHWQPPAFVARGVVVIEDAAERLAFLAADDLDPTVVPVGGVPERITAYVDERGTPPRGTIEWHEDRPLVRRFTARMEAPALVVVPTTHDPGWRASVGGTHQPIERVAHALQGLWLPAGTHEVELAYAPRSFALGVTLAGVALPVFFFLLLPRRPKRPAVRSR